MSRPALILAVLLAGSPAARALAAETPAASEAERRTPRIPDSLPKFNAPAVARDKLANGMRLALIEMHRLPLASVKLIFPYAGSSAADPGKEGLAGFAAAMMTEGTRRLPGRAELAEALEEVSGGIGFSVDADSLIVSVTTLKKDLDKALGLAAEMLRAPSFAQTPPPRTAQDSLARLKVETFQELTAKKGDPDSVAAERLAKRVFPGHPYGLSETEASVGSITLGDISSFHDGAVRPKDAVIAAAGDVDMTELKRLADKHFGSWLGAQGQTVAKTIPAAPPIKRAGAAPGAVAWKIDLVDMPGSQQSTLRLGHASIATDHPDYYAVKVMNYVLGGGAFGRIGRNLREGKSWTYDARSEVVSKREGGLFVVSTKVQTDKTAPAVLEILSEIKRIQDVPVPEEELAAVKRFMTGRFLAGTRTVQDVSDLLGRMETSGRPGEEPSKWVDAVGAVGPADVRRAAREHLGYEDIHIVVAGDAAKVYESLTAVAPVRVLDLDGREKPAPVSIPQDRT